MDGIRQRKLLLIFLEQFIWIFYFILSDTVARAP